MREEHLQILIWLATHGPASCLEIANALGYPREQVYRFLYKARCYGNGKGWIDNRKPGNDPYFFTGPGHYVVTPAGREVIALATINAQ